MRRPARPGFWLVVRREWRWITRDRAAPILIFAVPLLAFIILSAVFSQQVIRGLGVVVVDNDRSQKTAERMMKANSGTLRRARYGPATPSRRSTFPPISSAT